MPAAYWGGPPTEPQPGFTRSGITPRIDHSAKKLDFHAAVAIDKAKERLALSMAEMYADPLTARSGCDTPHTSRGSRPWTPRTMRNPFGTPQRSGSAPASARSFHPNQQLGLREQLTVEAQRIMEIADLSYLQAADPVSYTHLTLPTTPYV